MLAKQGPGIFCMITKVVIATPSCTIDTKSQKSVFIWISGCQKRHLIVLAFHCRNNKMCMNELSTNIHIIFLEKFFFVSKYCLAYC